MSHKIRDTKNRWRNKTVAFRMSPEEADALNLRVALSGLTKQEYITRTLLEEKVNIFATVRMHKAIRRAIAPLAIELRRIRKAGDMPERLIEQVETISTFVGSFAEAESAVDAEDAAILNMERDDSATLAGRHVIPSAQPQYQKELTK